MEIAARRPTCVRRPLEHVEDVWLKQVGLQHGSTVELVGVADDHAVFHRHVLTGWRYRQDSMSGLRRMRVLTWVLYMLPVLGAHAARCTESDRQLVARAVERHTREIVEAVTLISAIGGPQQ